MITWRVCCVQSAFGEVILPSESTDNCIHFSMTHCVLELMQVIHTLNITRFKKYHQNHAFHLISDISSSQDL